MRRTAIEIHERRDIAKGRKWFYRLTSYGRQEYGPFDDPEMALNAAIYRLQGMAPDGGMSPAASRLLNEGGEVSYSRGNVIYPAPQVWRATEAYRPERKKREAGLLAPIEAGGRQLDLIDAIGEAGTVRP